MEREVKIKGIKSGIVTGIPEDIPWNIAISMLEKKLNNEFFANSDIILDIGNREISRKEITILFELLDTLPVGLKGFVSLDEKTHTLLKKYGFSVSRSAEGLQNKSNSRYETWKRIEGTIRSGQKIESDSNILIIGDVNPDGEVSASGSIVVLGSLRGIARAGIRGEVAFIVAIRLFPQYVTIGKYWSDFSKEKEKLQEKPAIIFIEDENMVLRYL